MRVLLLGATGTEPSFQAWEAQLRRDGAPYTPVVATPGHTPIDAAALSQTLADGTQEARYQAVIVATGGLYTCDAISCTSALAPEEWAALQDFERTFNVRQLTAYVYPGADYGLNPPTYSGLLDGQSGSLTGEGRRVFPYLKGTVTFDVGTYGYRATPVDTTSFTTLLAGSRGIAFVGVRRHADGREELVQTFDGNQFQSHTALLRHGELRWVTRGTYLGHQRNYLELHVDDVFLPDDSWDPVANATSYDPAAAIRMTATDVSTAISWSRSTGLRLDMLYNGAGSDAEAAEHGSDPLLAPLQAAKDSFGWVNHTFEHPNLDCSTRAFIANQIRRNVEWARTAGFPVNAAELVTGEHSGLANLVPGSPGTIDPPAIEDVEPLALGALVPGTYDYALTATSAAGETIASRTSVTTTALELGVRLRWEAICKATSYHVYRRSSPDGEWARVGTVAQPSAAFTDAGPVTLAFDDRGDSATAAAPPSVNTAALAPYGQNPAFIGALNDTGIRSLGADASKPYPRTPTSTTGPVWPAGALFVDGPARVVPRYPTNVYYNVATQEQLLDEYNWLYLPPSLGGVCVDSAVTTCRTAPATWSELVALESQRIFGHIMGNDPRPHYFHQSNLAASTAPGGAVFYPVLDAALARYTAAFNGNNPLVQLSPLQIGNQLARQDAWATASDSSVSGYIEGARVALVNAGTRAIEAPLTGTEAGANYAGARSGWVNAPTGTSVHTAASAWPAPPPAPAQPVATATAGTS
jgi:hypothetical protein